MIASWPVIAVGAAAAQAVRTALQKRLTRDLSATSVSWVRFLYGFPFALAWLVLWARIEGRGIQPIWANADVDRFVVAVMIAACAQVGATLLLIYSFRLCNFAVATSYARTESVQVAIIGVLFFAHQIGLLAWVGIVICLCGTLAISAARRGGAQGLIDWKSAVVGLGSGFGFALASLYIREAAHALSEPSLVFAAAVTLAVTLVVQIIVLALPVALQRGQLYGVFRHWRAGLLVGATSAIGSAGWFTAMALVTPAYVKAVGQVEFLFVILISLFVFRERLLRTELIGMIAVVSGIVILLLALAA